MKIIQMPGREAGWKVAKTCPPPQVRELYIVVQKSGDEAIRNAAYYEQDGNGEWGFNKPDITHWMEWPNMPKEA